MMTYHEKWEHERNMDEIVERLSELLVNIMLVSVTKISDKFQDMNKHIKPKQPDDMAF